MDLTVEQDRAVVRQLGSSPLHSGKASLAFSPVPLRWDVGMSQF